MYQRPARRSPISPSFTAACPLIGLARGRDRDDDAGRLAGRGRAVEMGGDRAAPKIPE